MLMRAWLGSNGRSIKRPEDKTLQGGCGRRNTVRLMRVGTTRDYMLLQGAERVRQAVRWGQAQAQRGRLVGEEFVGSAH